MTDAPWREKAHRIITTLAEREYRRTNFRRDGKPYAKHRPYSLPDLARDLVACLDTDDEHRAKALFLSYDGLAALE